MPYKNRGRGVPRPEKVEPKTPEEIRAEEVEARDSRPVTTRCGFCEEFVFEGPFAEGREAAKAHRVEFHPKAAKTKGRRGGNLRGWINNDPGQKAEAMVEVEHRRKIAAASEVREENRGRKPVWSRESVIEHVQGLARELGRTPSAGEIKRSGLSEFPVRRIFGGGYPVAVTAAGLQAPRRGRPRGERERAA
jgi:hypothetical protein